MLISAQLNSRTNLRIDCRAATIAYRRRRAFTLLELMIVLVIMVAATAIIWPNLQKHLQRSSLVESASAVRQVLDDTRQRAMGEGKAYAIKLQIGSNLLQAMSVEQLLSESPPSALDVSPVSASSQSTSSQFASNDSNNTSPRQSQRIVELASSVVISEVRWSVERPSLEDNLLSEDDSNTEPKTTDAESTSPSRNLRNNSAESDRSPIQPKLANQAGGTAEDFWLPILANGKGRDTSITLYDTVLDESIEITYRSSTGLIEFLP